MMLMSIPDLTETNNTKKNETHRNAYITDTQTCSSWARKGILG